MIEALVAALVSTALAALGGWAIPALGMRALIPVLEASDRAVTNYRGERIAHGLGIAWVMWAVGLGSVGAVATLAARGIFWGFPIGTAADSAGTLMAAIAPLVLAAFAFGFIDDVFGGADEKGFRGHLAAARGGRLTTGMLKLLGIGFASAVAAIAPAGWILARMSEADMTRLVTVGDWWVWAQVVLAWGLGTAVIALTCNLVNLLDLRPGRALKGYIAIAAPAGIVWVFAATLLTREVLAGVPGLTEDRFTIGIGLAGAFVSVMLVVMGPVLAVWRYDLSERGMLGDAGANAAGAFAGFLLVAALSTSTGTWGLAAATVVLLALNLASERVSFSEAIAGSGFLWWLDGLGRVATDDRAVLLERARARRAAREEGGAGTRTD